MAPFPVPLFMASCPVPPFMASFLPWHPFVCLRFRHPLSAPISGSCCPSLHAPPPFCAPPDNAFRTYFGGGVQTKAKEMDELDGVLENSFRCPI
eukprot:1004015-Rhodomonas_salina.1